MYGGNPLVPLTGFGIPVGAAVLAGYPVLAALVTAGVALLTGWLLFRSKVHANQRDVGG
ncbi:MAG: hypothetical protein K6T78_04230 [Alicyclobacillus sp.]|nr:hypothetical protein [Alicyclobacillus sp.]